MKLKLYFLFGFLFLHFIVFSQSASYLNFDGTNDYVVLPLNNTEIPTTNFTHEFWFKTTDLNGTMFTATVGTSNAPSGWDRSIYIDNGKVSAYIWVGAPSVLSTTASFNDGNWHHVAHVLDATGSKLYVDSNLEASNTVTSSVFTTNTDVVLGISPLAGASYYQGDLEEVRVWNVAKTATQINAAKNCELQGNETGLVAYYKFNQGNDQANNSGVTSLTDATSNANTGTLINFTLNSTTSNWLAGSLVFTPNVATVTTPVIYTQGATATALSATSGATGLLWYTTATGGTGTTIAPLPSTVNPGSTSYWVSSTNANGCESARTEIVVTINAVITNAPTTSFETQVYTGDDKDLTTLQVTGSNIKWYNVATGSSPLANTTLLVDETTYYASQTLNGSESTNRLAVTVKRISDNTQILPANSTVANLIAAPRTGTAAQWFLGATGGTALPDTDVLSNGTYYVNQFSPIGIEILGSGFNNPGIAGIQSDSKIVVIDNGNSIKRMNADGSNIEVLISGDVYCGVAIQPNGKIVVSDCTNNVLKRIDSDGTNMEVLASGFIQPRSIAIQSDGKILVADNDNNSYSIKRLDEDGSNIITLISGYAAPYGLHLAVQSNGKIVIANTYFGSIERMDPDGTNIEVLGSGFMYPSDVDIQSDGKIVVTDNGNYEIKRMDTDGSNIETIASGLFYGTVAIQADGKFVTTCSFDNSVRRITEAQDSNRVPVVVDVTTLSSENFENNEIAVYPNPSNGIFTIDAKEAVTVEVYDMIGKKVFNSKVALGSSNLDLSNHANGIYLLMVTNQNGSATTYKLIKQ